MSLQTRRALLKQFAPPYRKASSKRKRLLLDAFAKARSRGDDVAARGRVERASEAASAEYTSRCAAREPFRDARLPSASPLQTSCALFQCLGYVQRPAEHPL